MAGVGDNGDEVPEVEVEVVPLAKRQPRPTDIGQPLGPKPGRPKGCKVFRLTRLAQFPQHIIDIVSIPLEVILKDEKLYRTKLEEAARKNPVGFMVKVIIPLTKVLPSALVASLIGRVGENASETGPRAQLSAINVLLEAAERGEVDLEQLERAIEERAVHSVEEKH